MLRDHPAWRSTKLLVAAIGHHGSGSAARARGARSYTSQVTSPTVPRSPLLASRTLGLRAPARAMMLVEQRIFLETGQEITVYGEVAGSGGRPPASGLVVADVITIQAVESTFGFRWRRSTFHQLR